MRIVAFSDAHFDAVTAGVMRFNEVQRACDRVVEIAREKQADLVVFLGDLCDPDSVCAHAAAAEAVRLADKLVSYGIKSRWLVGNHDVVEDGRGDSTLSPLAEVDYGGDLDAMVDVYKGPDFEVMEDHNAVLVALPYTARSHNYDPAAFVRGKLPELRAYEHCPIVVLSHLMIEGIGPGSETESMARGRDVFLPLRELSTLPNVVVLSGHYHKPQRLDGAPVVHVVGSVVRLRFDEAGNETGCLVIDV